MYLHIGNQKNIRKKQIIGIFDTDNSTLSETTRKFLRKNEREGRVSSAIAEIPKSFVLYNGLSADSYGRSSERRRRKRASSKPAEAQTVTAKASKRKKKQEETVDLLTASVCFSQLSSTSLTGRGEAVRVKNK